LARRHGGEHVSKAVLISSITPFRLKTDTNPEGTTQEKFDETMEKLKQDRMAFWMSL